MVRFINVIYTEMSIDESEKTEEEIIKESLGPFKSEMSPAEIEKFVSARGSKIEGINLLILKSNEWMND